jgi:glycosyltransferase involved in cell wall biosynthesis
LSTVRVCLVYDCLFPHTVGGAEHWYRGVVERLAAEGHEVTYLTLRQWDRGADPGVPSVDVITAGPRLALYTRSGRRRILPPLIFGAGVLWHLARRGRRYDVIHTASFPYFSLLAAGFLRRWGRYRLVVDWLELWTLSYWQDYLGRIGGWVGWRVQRACVRVPQRAFCLSELHAARLREEGLRSEVTVLRGIYAAPEPDAQVEAYVDPGPVVFAGRHIAEKRVPSLIPALARLAGVRGEIYGDGPERERVLALIRAHGLEGRVSAPGFVPHERVDAALRSALCLVLPSRREGYGLVVVEACATGTPAVVVADPDNAATELIEEGVNGFVAASDSPDDLAAAIVRVREGGAALRASTAEWYRANARRLSLEDSLERVAEAYRA